MPHRLPTAGIPTPAVRKSSGAQPAAQPMVVKSTGNAKPMSPADRQANAKRPMVGNDKAVAKKVGKGSWNNGYTN